MYSISEYTVLFVEEGQVLKEGEAMAMIYFHRAPYAMGTTAAARKATPDWAPKPVSASELMQKEATPSNKAAADTDSDSGDDELEQATAQESSHQSPSVETSTSTETTAPAASAAAGVPADSTGAADPSENTCTDIILVGESVEEPPKLPAVHEYEELLRLPVTKDMLVREARDQVVLKLKEMSILPPDASPDRVRLCEKVLSRPGSVLRPSSTFGANFKMHSTSAKIGELLQQQRHGCNC